MTASTSQLDLDGFDLQQSLTYSEIGGIEKGPNWNTLSSALPFVPYSRSHGWHSHCDPNGAVMGNPFELGASWLQNTEFSTYVRPWQTLDMSSQSALAVASPFNLAAPFSDYALSQSDSQSHADFMAEGHVSHYKHNDLTDQRPTKRAHITRPPPKPRRLKLKPPYPPEPLHISARCNKIQRGASEIVSSIRSASNQSQKPGQNRRLEYPAQQHDTLTCNSSSPPLPSSPSFSSSSLSRVGADTPPSPSDDSSIEYHHLLLTGHDIDIDLDLDDSKPSEKKPSDTSCTNLTPLEMPDGSIRYTTNWFPVESDTIFI